MAVSHECQHQRCRRRVREDYPGFPYCKDHRGHSVSYTQAMGRQAEGIQPLPHSAIQPVGLQSVGLVSQHTPADPRTASIILAAAHQWSEGRDMSIPDNAIGRMGHAAWGMRDALAANGVQPGRISLLRLEGLNRKAPSGRVQRSGDYAHSAVVLDHGTPRQVVVDPVVSVFAPVRDPAVPVDDQLPSGETPYGDSPWVGEYGEYVSGDQFWWDRHDVAQRW